MKLDDFTTAFIVACLWSTNDESTPAGGEPLDNNYGVEDLAPEALAKIQEECERFQQENAADIATWSGVSPAEQAGHDFSLTRNRHGCGFWESEWGEVGEVVSG